MLLHRLWWPLVEGAGRVALWDGHAGVGNHHRGGEARGWDRGPDGRAGDGLQLYVRRQTLRLVSKPSKGKSAKLCEEKEIEAFLPHPYEIAGPRGEAQKRIE